MPKRQGRRPDDPVIAIMLDIVALNEEERDRLNEQLPTFEAAVKQGVQDEMKRSAEMRAKSAKPANEETTDPGDGQEAA